MVISVLLSSMNTAVKGGIKGFGVSPLPGVCKSQRVALRNLSHLSPACMGRSGKCLHGMTSGRNHTWRANATIASGLCASLYRFHRYVRDGAFMPCRPVKNRIRKIRSPTLTRLGVTVALTSNLSVRNMQWALTLYLHPVETCTTSHAFVRKSATCR